MFSFDPQLATAKDRLRRALGDTDATSPLREDAEYLATITNASDDESLALAVLARGLAAEYAQLPDSISSDGTSISWRERVKTWLTIATSASTMSVTLTSGVTSGVLMRDDDGIDNEYSSPRYWWN